MKRLFFLAVVSLVLLVAPPSLPAESSPVNADTTCIAAGTRTLPLAPLGPLNPWPQFRFQLPERPIEVPAGLSAEDRAGMFTNASVPPLPYLLQDNYTRQRQPGQLPTVVVENKALRATFYPSLGGRLASLYDKRAGRELLFDNPVFQPANLAIRNAWFSGGVEWNGPLYGHSLLTCSPIYAGLLQTGRGPLLRLYEFDRALETTWQVDVLLPRGDDRLWVHVKARNPNPHAIDFYWWTNIAMRLEPRTRVLAPFDYVLSHTASGNSRGEFPMVEGRDGSYPVNYHHAQSIFFRKPASAQPWMVAIDGEGRGLSHVSTTTLSGRKLFTWGTSRGGKHWVDFLSEDGRGDYIEIQGGVTPTQLQTRPLAAGQSLEWTECLAPIAIDVPAAHNRDYAVACSAASAAVGQRVPVAEMHKIDALLTSTSDAPLEAVLHRGAVWGRLHEERTGKRLSPGLTFDAQPEEAERPWAELAAGGRFSPESLREPPRSFAVSAGWTSRLQQSLSRQGATWLHHLHLGVAFLEAKDFQAARQHFQASLDRQECALAHRCLALIHQRDGNLAAAQASYERAWQRCVAEKHNPAATRLQNSDEANLAVEIDQFFLRHRRFAEFARFTQALPDDVRRHERIQLMQAEVALAEGDYPAVRRLLDREFCTIREGEVSLSELWFASYIEETQKRVGRPLTTAEKQQLMAKYPPPRAIDFRMR